MTVFRKTRVLPILFLVVGIVLMLNYVADANQGGSGSPGGVSANLQLWLKADAGTSTTTDGTNVTSWLDQSPNGWTATNQVENVPTYHMDAINFNPAVTFGTLGRTELSIGTDYPKSPAGSSGLTIFAAFDPDSDLNTPNFIVDVGRANGDGYGLAGSAGAYYGYNSTTNTGGDGTGAPLITGSVFGEIPALLTHQVQFGVGNTLYANGAPLTSTVNLVLNQLDNNNVNFNSTHQTTRGPVTIGRQAKNGHINSGGGRYFRGDIAEVIIYNAAITGTEKVKVESYLAIKYGITLSDTVDYLASDGTIIYPSTGSHNGYTNDIAGVAVDTGSDLTQLTSRSVNPDSVVIVTGTLSTMSSGEFLVWGNDDGAFTPSSEVPPGSPAGQRLTREWRVAETGDVGGVTVSFDLSNVAGDFDFSNPAGFALLIDGDGDFSDATVTTGATVNGQVVTFDGVDFNSGEYYTLAYSTEEASTMHVGDLDGSSSMNGGRWNAHVVVTIHDADENPVVNATVNGSWGNGTTGTGSCVTDSSGQCTLTKNNLRGTVNSVSFTVTDVTLDGSTYQSGSNHDPDGDSDGTTIVVFKDGQPGPTPTPAPTATPGPSIVLHVGDLDGSGISSGSMWEASVVVTVHNDSEEPVAGATVKGSWSGGATGSGSCVTDLLGQCTIAKSLRGNILDISLTITNVTLAGATYDAGANHDPDGDSNGTVITVSQP